MKTLLYICGGERESMRWEIPLGIGYLLANCNGELEYTRNAADLAGADLIGLSANAWGIGEAVEILKSHPHIPCVIGGQGALWSALDQFGFAAVVRGDGEYAMQEILDGTTEVIDTRVHDIDTLNWPERGECGETVPVVTSRGCPFDCAFCSSKAFWGRPRYHSAEYVLSEIEYLLGRYPQMQTLYVLDDLFATPPSRFAEIHAGWMGRGWHKRLGLLAFVRSSTFTREMGLMLKEMGMRRARFGAESGSDAVLKRLNKRATVADHQRLIDTCKEIGLPVSASFMRGTPGETDEDRRLTAEFKKKNEGVLSVEGDYVFRAFPGTTFYDGADLIQQEMRVR